MKFKIDGMSCDGCAAALKSALEKLPAVESAEVSFPERSATVHLTSPDALSAREIVEAVEAAGYEATPA